MPRRPLIAGSITLGTMGQLLMKLGMANFNPTDNGTLINLAKSNIPVLLLISVGIFCYLIAVVCWILVLRTSSLNSVYPYLSLTYIFVFLGAALIPGIEESISLTSCIGLLVILAGLHIASEQSLVTRNSVEQYV